MVDEATSALTGANGGNAAFPQFSTNEKAGAAQGAGVTPPTGQSAASLTEQARDRAIQAGESGKEAIAGQIDALADAVHRSGEPFEGKQDWIAQAIDGGAEQLSTLAASLRDNDISAILGQVKQIARERPGLFIGASFAAGFALSRFGKLVAADLSRDDLPTLPELHHG